MKIRLVPDALSVLKVGLTFWPTRYIAVVYIAFSN